MFTIYKTGHFEAAHQLKGHPKCGKLHGHSYKFEVWITSETLQEPHEFVLDFQEVSNYFKQLDHSDKVIKVSAEVIALTAHKNFRKLLPLADRIKVRIWETVTSSAEYYG